MKKSIMLLMAAVILAAVIGLTGCELLGSKEIIYEVSGTAASVDIRYEDENGDLVEVYGASPYWRHSFTVNRVAAAILVYVSAEITALGGGDVTVSISEDIFLVDSASASGYGDLAEAWGIIE
jgi:hypothetical protein